MTRRDLLKSLPMFGGIPLIGKFFKPNPLSDIIRTLPFGLFDQYKPGDDIFWYEWPYWDVKLTGKVEAVRLDGTYKYLVVRVDEHSKGKLTDQTRFPMWAMQVRQRSPYSQTTYTAITER